MSRIFGPARQVAMVVRDIDCAMAIMIEKMGVGPFFVMRDLQPEDYRYRGNTAPSPVLSLAFAFTGQINIELIQQHNDAPSAYRDFLELRGEGAQHLSSWTAEAHEYDAIRENSLASGRIIAHEGRIGQSRFAYFDTTDPIFGMCFEVAEGLSPDLAPIVAHMCDAANGWDGSDPVRPFA
ncbi:VOC family protein [Sphingomonas sp.]|uniref:VOC family protein n=1 Tax=Sphingomonas sp. TaxID=28214 RepID=UPI003750B739